VRSDTSAGPERVRRQPPGGIDRRPLSVLLLACRIASNPVPARKRWLSAAPREMDSLLAGKTETGASLRLQRRVPLPTALSLGSCLGFGGDETPMIRATVASFGVLRIVVLGLFLPSRIITPPKRHFTLPPKE
jgi:hypothetical protein